MKNIKKTKLIMLGLLIFSNVGLMTMEQNPVVRLYQSIFNRDVIGVRNAIEQGADVNQANSLYEDILPIFYAVESGNPEIVQELINAGVDIRVVDMYDKTPLIRAVENNCLPIIDILLGLRVYNYGDIENAMNFLNAENLQRAHVLELLQEAINPGLK